MLNLLNDALPNDLDKESSFLNIYRESNLKWFALYIACFFGFLSLVSSVKSEAYHIKS